MPVMPQYAIVVENDDEPRKRRFTVFGPFADRQEAYDNLRPIVRDMIEDPDGESHTPEELDAEVERIASTGDGDAFGFWISIADMGSV